MQRLLSVVRCPGSINLHAGRHQNRRRCNSQQPLRECQRPVPQQEVCVSTEPSPRGLTFLIPLHGHSVSFEEALVGQCSGGSSQRRVLVQTHKGRRSFRTRGKDGHLQGAAEAGSDSRDLPVSARGVLGLLHLTGLSSRRQHEVRNFLHVKFVGNCVWKNTVSRRTNNMIITMMIIITQIFSM